MNDLRCAIQVALTHLHNGADVLAVQALERAFNESADPCHAVDTGFPNAEQRRYLIELLRAAKCPEPRCTDGSIISTGPDPQNDACQWCYQRHVTIEALQEGHSQCNPQEADRG